MLPNIEEVKEIAAIEAIEEVVEVKEIAPANQELAVRDTASAPAGAAAKPAELEALDQKWEDSIVIDFTSFPTIVLDNAVFNTPEHKAFATEFTCRLLEPRDQFLYRADRGRDLDPELAYSNDQITEASTERLMSEIVAEWEAKNYQVSISHYTIVVVEMLDGVHAGELCQIQISPASRGKWGGYLQGLKFRKLKPEDVVTKVMIGAEVGKGLKAFNPFVFKEAGRYSA